MTAIAEVIDESIRNMTGNMVTKADQEKVRAYTILSCLLTHTALQHHYTQQVDFAQLKSELQLMEKNDLSMIKAENERLVTDIDKLKARLREEVARTQAGVRLDLNLEKGRIREEASRQELKMKEVDTRIEQEIAGLRAAIQSSKATTLQYIVGFGTSPHVNSRVTSDSQLQSLVVLHCSWRTCVSAYNITLDITIRIPSETLAVFYNFTPHFYFSRRAAGGHRSRSFRPAPQPGTWYMRARGRR